MLPPDSFLTLKLPFIYGVETDQGSLHPLNPLDHQPERTAWLVERTALQLVSVGNFPAVV
jgi:protein SMG8